MSRRLSTTMPGAGVGTLAGLYAGADAMMMQAIRKVNAGDWPTVMRVGTAFCPQSMVCGASQNAWMRKAKIRIRVFTHSDLLCDAALKRVAKFWDLKDPEGALFFVNTKSAEKRLGIKGKDVKLLRQSLYGACFVAGHDKKVLVCGVPNVGKSSIILPLTRAAVETVRKKKAYHNAKVSSIAGRTAAVKGHRLDDSPFPVIMHDTPGIVPPAGLTSEAQLQLLFTAGFLTKSAMPFRSSKQWPVEALMKIALGGLNRHGRLNQGHCDYVSRLGLTAPTEDGDAVLAKLNPNPNLRHQAFDKFIAMCRAGDLGGWLLDDLYDQAPTAAEEWDETEWHDSFLRAQNKRAHIVFANKNARHLAEIAGQLHRESDEPHRSPLRNT